jgi:isoleucyl-tRNA synthetase
MPQAAAAVQALDPAAVAAAVAGERKVGIQVNGSEHELEPSDVTLVLQPLDGYQVEAESGRAVALSLELDDELRHEGLAREVVHAVQNARRQAGLEVTDRIELRLGGEAELLDAARAHEEYVAGETLATSVAYGDGADTSGPGLSRVEIEGRELAIAVSKA